MENIQEVRALNYCLISADDTSCSDQEDQLIEAIELFVNLADDLGCNLGLLAETESGGKYRILVVKEPD